MWRCRNCPRFSASIFADDLEPAAAEAPLRGLHGHHHVSLAGRAAAPFPACFDATDEGLVDLDVAAEQVLRGAAHRGAQLVAHRPGGLIRPEPEQWLKRCGTDAVLRDGHQPGGLEPHRQRRAGVLEDRAGEYPDSLAAACARPASGRQSPALLAAAVRAAEAVGPPQPVQVVQACRVVREPGAHRGEVARVVHLRLG